MMNQEPISPHAGYYYQTRWGFNYFLSVIKSIPDRIEPYNLLAGALPGTVPGIDISHWQGDLTLDWWVTAYNEGYRFVFLKATEGLEFADPKYAINKTNAQLAGFKVGAYHFARPEKSGIRQAEFFISVAGELDIGGVWDLEDDGGVDDIVVNSRTEDFLSTLNSHYEYSWMYSAAWFLDPRQINPQVPYYRWVAHWTTASEPYMPRIWRDREYDAWQHSNSEEVAGKTPINGNRMQKTLFDNLTDSTNGEYVTIRVKQETIDDLRRALAEAGRINL
jgi:GH25 family lysozyme M1 (1,4-beta-N-acetylmuramidase)